MGDDKGPIDEAHRPVVVGVAQRTLRDGAASEPLGMLEGVARECAEDAGISAAQLAGLDAVGLVDVIAWRPRNGPRLLAERLGAHPKKEWSTGIGGEMPLALLNRVASEVAAGNTRMALLAGCNNVPTLMRLRAENRNLDWPTGGEGTPERFGSDQRGASEAEVAAGLATPTDIYPIFENAVRAGRGLDLETHRRGMGALFARFSEVAASNPHSWFPVKRSAEELVEVTERNRMIAFPYPKYLNAVLNTEQAAALLLTSAGHARALGIPESRWVHWWGGASAVEPVWFATERDGFDTSPALRATGEAALERAGTRLDEIDHFDLYSCFPVAVEMACDMLGLAEDDARGLTLTGGLPYHGGPGNNYGLHALAAATEKLRQGPGERALLTGNGWYLTKHSASVLASAPREDTHFSDAGAVPVPDAGPGVERDEAAEGSGRIETYTVVYDREGAPKRGIVAGRLESGRRFLANTPEERGLLEDFVAHEQVGRSGRVSHSDSGVPSLFEPH